MSDIHFNPMADPSLMADLTTADPARWEAILQRSKPSAFSQYGEDTNWWLLQSALNQMHATLPHPALVIYTGDLLAHRFRITYVKATGDNDNEHYRAFVLKTVKFLAIQLDKRFGGIPILLTPGNNDDDCGDYAIQPNGAFLNDTADVVRNLAKGDAALSADWKSLGSYSVPHPTVANLRIIALNTVFLSQQYKPQSLSTDCQPAPSNGAQDVLSWLGANIDNAKQQNQRVWLMFHIPPGIDGYASTHPPKTSAPGSASAAESCVKEIIPMWVPDWTSQFDDLLENYRDTVTASFAGHTHTDDFRLISAANGVNEAFVLISPAVSPIYNQNPAFRVVDFRSDGTVIDQSTYYLTNLKKASSTKKGHWKREYQFDRKWRSPQLDLESLGKIYDEVRETNKARDQWAKLYMVSSPVQHLSPTVIRGLYCAIGSLNAASYQSCYCSAKGSNTGDGAPTP